MGADSMPAYPNQPLFDFRISRPYLYGDVANAGQDGERRVRGGDDAGAEPPAGDLRRRPARRLLQGGVRRRRAPPRRAAAAGEPALGAHHRRRAGVQARRRTRCLGESSFLALLRFVFDPRRGLLSCRSVEASSSHHTIFLSSFFLKKPIQIKKEKSHPTPSSRSKTAGRKPTRGVGPWGWLGTWGVGAPSLSLCSITES
jgi:hypothetical protein